MVFSYVEVRERFSAFLGHALTQDQVKLSSRDRRAFASRPERLPKVSRFDIRSTNLPITQADSLESLQESRTRYW